MNKIKKKDFILNLNTLLTEEENEVSFPIWFNDSIIKSQKINKITRKIYPLNHLEDNPLKNFKNSIPRESREYYFDKQGNIYQLNVHYFYDDREIGSVLFTYEGNKDKNGFSQVSKKTIVNKTSKRIAETHEINDPTVRELYFKMHVKRSGGKKYLSYQDMETGDFMYFMVHSKYWGPLSIDSILTPKKSDVIGWGNPKFPSKKYQVHNKVNETNVREYIYDSKNTEMPLYWIKKDYPFDLKRTFIYNQKGFCKGYVDSTFADQKFVTRITANMLLNKEKNPIKIIHKKENQSNQPIFYSIETFDYEK